MSRPLFYNDPSYIDEVLAKAKEQLTNSPIGFETKAITIDLESSKERAELIFTPTAWLKMKALVDAFSTEVEWHGLVRRASKNSFVVEDILNFAHEASGATVTSQQEAYNKFLDSLSDDVFDKLKFHGHSHVYMDTSPSCVDMRYRKNVVSNTGMPTEEYDEFQIFVIWNKRNEYEAQIYDLTNNILYGKKDIDVHVAMEDGTTLESFIEEAKKLVTTATHTTAGYNNSYAARIGEMPNTGTAVGFGSTCGGNQTTKFKKSDYYDGEDDDDLSYVGSDHSRPMLGGVKR